PTFETFDFAANSFTALSVKGMDGGDVIDLVGFATAEASLATVTLDGDNTANSDASADTLIVRSSTNLPATSVINLLGGAGNDAFILDSTPSDGAASGTVDGIAVQVRVSPAPDEGGTDSLTIVDTDDTTGDVIAITTTTIEGITGFAGAPDVTYNASGGNLIETVNVFTSNASSSGDTVNVQSTMASSVYNLSTQGGNDVVNVSSNAPTLTTGTLNDVDGQLNVSTGAGTDSLNLSDQGDTAADAYTLSLVSGVTELTFGDGSAAVDVRYDAVGGAGQ